MNAYRLKLVFAKYSTDVLQATLLSDQPKAKIVDALAKAGWELRGVSGASADDLYALPTFEELRQKVKDAISTRESETKRKAAEAERSRVDRERREVLEKAEERKRYRASAEYSAKQYAGDLLATAIEPAAASEVCFAVIAQKLELFIQDGSMNKRDIYTAISLDVAECKARFARTYPNGCSILAATLTMLNRWFQLEEMVARSETELRHREVEANADLRTIGSRSHVFGGSGWGLLLSAAAATSAVKQDEAAMRSIQSRFAAESARVNQFTQKAVEEITILQMRLRCALASLSGDLDPLEAAILAMPKSLVFPSR